MKFEIDFADGANEDLERFRAYDRLAILDLIEKHLRHQPTRESKSRIKALRGLSKPQYRLRVGDIGRRLSPDGPARFPGRDGVGSSR